MKRILATILVLLSVTGCAFADTEKPIEFHGIPWGIDILELAEVLNEKNIPVRKDKISNDANMAIWSYEFRNSFMNDIEETGHKIRLNFYSEAPKIAGYPVKEFSFYAHYDITNGILKKGENESRYYMAALWFDVNDEMAVSVFNDLAKKLTSLYGNGAENSTFIVDTTYTYIVWNGADDTAVCLYRSESTSSDYQFVHIMYGKTNIEETLQNVRKSVIEKKIQDVSNDTTGL